MFLAAHIGMVAADLETDGSSAVLAFISQSSVHLLLSISFYPHVFFSCSVGQEVSRCVYILQFYSPLKTSSCSVFNILIRSWSYTALGS